MTVHNEKQVDVGGADLSQGSVLLSASNSGISVNITKPPYNALPGVTGNPEVIIQTALKAVSVAGGGEVYVPKGVYSGMELHTIPGQTAISACVWLYSNVRLRCDPGAEFVLANGAKRPAPTTQAHIVSELVPFTTKLSEVKTGIVIENLTVNGNVANQTAPEVSNGIFHGASKNAWNFNCVVKGIWGNSTSGEGETFAYEHNNTWGGGCLNCEADGSGSANTATGFSSDDAFDTLWASCTAHGMGHAQGFTTWQGSGQSWVGCRSWGNGQSGFNVERSENFTFTGCIAGGTSPLMGETNPFFEAGRQKLPNGTGYQIQGCANFTIDASCQSFYNTNYGVAVIGEPAGNGVNVKTNGTLNSTTTVTGLEAAKVSKLQVGMGVEGAKIAAKTVISELVSTTSIKLSIAATGSATEELTFDHFRVCYGGRVYGTHRLNGVNVFFDDVTYGLQQDCISVSANSFESPTTNVQESSARGPYLRYVDRIGESGLRIGIQASAATGSNRTAQVLRILNEQSGHFPLKINGTDQLITLGRARAYAPVAFDSTAAPQNDIVAYTAVAAPRIAHLPLSSQLETGSEFLVMDASGAASSTNTITLALAEGDTATIVGTSVISSAYGRIQVIFDGTKFLCAPMQALGAHKLQEGWILQTHASGTISGSSIGPAGVASLAGASGWANVFRINPADFPAWATLQLKLVLNVDNTAPATNFYASLLSVASPAGAAGGLTYTPGESKMATATATAPAANSTTEVVATPIAVPAAALYAVTFTSAGTPAEGSGVGVRATLNAVY